MCTPARCELGEQDRECSIASLPSTRDGEGISSTRSAKAVPRTELAETARSTLCQHLEGLVDQRGRLRM